MFPRTHIFWHFYLGILLSLFIIVFASFAFLAYQQSEHDISDFWLDTSYIAQEVNRQESSHQYDEDKLLTLGIQYGFSVKAIHLDELALFTAPLLYLESIQDTDIYEEDEQGLLIAIRQLENNNKALIISDLGEDVPLSQLSDFAKRQQAIEERDIELETSTLKIMVLGIVTAIGLLLLALLAWVRKMITPLEQTCEKWRVGQLDARIDTDAPKPFDSLASTLNKMAQDLQQRIQEQQVMTSAMSHELRNPLNGLSLSMELLARKHQSLQDEPLFGEVKKYADELESLSLNMLTLGKLQQHEQTLNEEVCSLSHLLEQRVQHYQSTDDAPRITLKYQRPIAIEAPILYVKLIIDNLLTNACRHAASTVSVSLNESDSHIELIISDDGQGIDDQYLATVFMPFLRPDNSRSRKSGGFGLGLAIVKSCVDKLNAEVTLTNQANSGLQVKVLLPLMLASDSE